VSEGGRDGKWVPGRARGAAADGVTETLNQLATKKVSDIDAKKADFGDDDLGETVSDFCDRWELGVEHLAKDVQEIATRLNASVEAYLRTEQANQVGLDGVLAAPSDDDPAAH
jgi:hypothetical protein